MSTARLRAELMLSPLHCGAVTGIGTKGENKAPGNIFFLSSVVGAEEENGSFS